MREGEETIGERDARVLALESDEMAKRFLAMRDALLRMPLGDESPGTPGVRTTEEIDTLAVRLLQVSAFEYIAEKIAAMEPYSDLNAH